MSTTPERQWRVQFDAEVTFRNGGGLRVWEFRLDAPGHEVSDADLGEMLVRDMGLLMVDQVRVTAKTMIEEPHKGSRLDRQAVPSPGQDHPSRARGLSDPGSTLCLLPARHPGLPGLVDLNGIVVRTTGSVREQVDRMTLLPENVPAKAVLLHTGQTDDTDVPALTEDAAHWLVAEGAALVGFDSPPVRVFGTPAAQVLAAAGIPLVAGLAGLDELPPRAFRLHVVPEGAGLGDPQTCTVYAITTATGPS